MNSKIKLKDIGNIDSLFSDKTIDFTNVKEISKGEIPRDKQEEFLKGFTDLHKLRNDFCHIGGMGNKEIFITPDHFKSFIRSLKILFNSANWYRDGRNREIVNQWENSLEDDWLQFKK